MRVLFVNFASDWGGGEGWTLRSALGLAAQEHDVGLVARPNSQLERRASAQEGLRLFTLTPAFDYQPNAVARLMALMKRLETEVLVVHHNRDVRTAGVAARLLGIPVVHRNGFPVIHDNLRHRFTQLFVDRIVTNSRRIEKRYRGYGWLRHPIDVVPNGTPLPEKVSPRDPERFGFARENLVACYAGRLTGVKRVQDLFEALRSLPEGSRWRLAIIGRGSTEGQLAALAVSPGLVGRVRMLGFREDAPELLGAADLAVLPSADEGMPNALMEAMARGTALAATPVGDVELLLGAGEAGWSVPVCNVAAWVDLLQTLEAEPKRLEERGLAGRHRIEAQFTHEAMVEGIEASLAAAMATRT